MGIFIPAPISFVTFGLLILVEAILEGRPPSGSNLHLYLKVFPVYLLFSLPLIMSQSIAFSIAMELYAYPRSIMKSKIYYYLCGSVFGVLAGFTNMYLFTPSFSDFVVLSSIGAGTGFLSSVIMGLTFKIYAQDNELKN